MPRQTHLSFVVCKSIQIEFDLHPAFVKLTSSEVSKCGRGEKKKRFGAVSYIDQCFHMKHPPETFVLRRRTILYNKVVEIPSDAAYYLDTTQPIQYTQFFSRLCWTRRRRKQWQL